MVIGLIATLYRPKEATLSVLLYLLLGAIDLPVFSGGNDGLHTFIGQTHSPILTTLKLVVLPFVLPDLIKITLTTLFSLLLLKALQSQSYFKI